MLNYFKEPPGHPDAKPIVFDGDCYVADYTHDSENERGVEISAQPFDDITSFHLKKKGPGNILYQAVNLEKYPVFISGIDNCECIFNALSECRRPWLMFLETKYVEKPENIDNYPVKAYTQMAETLGRLVEFGLVKAEERRIYFVYSSPPYSDYQPFGEFALSQNDYLKELEQKGIVLLGYNEMLILTPQYLRIPERRI